MSSPTPQPPLGAPDGGFLERMMGAPMAAPETARLRTMRLVWMTLLFATAAVILGIPLLKLVLLPKQIGLLALGLIFLSAVHSWVYLSTKNRADDRHHDAAIARLRAEDELA